MLSIGPLIFAFILFCASAMELINLGTTDDFVIPSKTGVSTTGMALVTEDVGTSPIAETAITGFSLILDSTTTFSTSSLVTENLYAESYTSPTPSKMTTAISDMAITYTDAAGRPTPDEIELGDGNIENHILPTELYKWGTSIGFTSSLTLNSTNAYGKSDADAVWILQISGDLTVGLGAIVALVGVAKAENIF